MTQYNLWKTVHNSENMFLYYFTTNRFSCNHTNATRSLQRMNYLPLQKAIRLLGGGGHAASAWESGQAAWASAAAGELFSSRPRGSCKTLEDKYTLLNTPNASEGRAASSAPVKQRRGYESVDVGDLPITPPRRVTAGTQTTSRLSSRHYRKGRNHCRMDLAG